MHSLLTICMFAIFVLGGCSKPGPSPIKYGTDLCHYCDMTIADKAFGTELVTKKGKVFKFDSIECLAAAEHKQTGAPADFHSRWTTDFNNPGSFLRIDNAILVATDRQKSPMGIGLVAVRDQKAAKDLIAAKGGRVVSWEETIQLVAESWRL